MRLLLVECNRNAAKGARPRVPCSRPCHRAGAMTDRRVLAALAVAVVVLAALLIVLIAEGIHALARFDEPDTALTYKLADWIVPMSPQPDPHWPELVHLAEITPYLPQLKANAVGIGSSTFEELRTDEASINHVVDGCLQMKPNLSKTMSYLRSELFNPLNPMFYFHELGPGLAERPAGLSRPLQLPQAALDDERRGQRITVPLIERADKVLIAGDSMAMSLGVGDEEALASQLQVRDPSRQYVSIGIGGADPADILCALKRAGERYRGQIRAVIYPLSENDLADRKPFGRPEELIPALVKFRQEHAIGEFTLVYMPYIYNAMPDVTRIRGHVEYLRRRPHEQKRALLELAQKANFRVLDYTDVTDAERARHGSQFAAFALFVDHAHLSRLGNARLVERLEQP